MINTDPLGRFAEHASKPYPTDHIAATDLVRHWEAHYAYELRGCPAAELRWTLDQTQAEIAALEANGDLGRERLVTKFGKLQGKELAVQRLLEAAS